MSVPLFPVHFDQFEDAYVAVLEQVLFHPHHRVDSRGNSGRECRNVTFTIDHPLSRSIHNPARRMNPAFCWAEFLWYTAGRADLEMIGYYAPGLSRHSADGITLTGSAYGPRLFGGSSERTQWQRVVALLKEDPDSKRAVLSLFGPTELADTSHPDVTCTLALQFVIREGALHLVAMMRGNDALIGLACDVHAFTLIQEFTARRLGVEVGTYTHQVTSMHINDVTFDWAAAVVDTARREVPNFRTVPMPVTTTWLTLAAVQTLEEELRTNRRRLCERDLELLGLEPYWQQVVLLFELHRQIKHEPAAQVEPWLPAALDPGNRWLARHRWPDRIADGEVRPCR